MAVQQSEIIFVLDRLMPAISTLNQCGSTEWNGSMAKTLNLAHLINSLLAVGIERAATSSPAVAESAGTTIRFPPELRAFLDTQASTLGVSLASVVTMILNAVMLETLSEPKGTALADKMQLMAQRFRLLLEDHSIDIPTALELFRPDGIDAAVLSNPTMLIDKLDSRLIDRIAKTFSVDAKWLRAEDDYPGRRVDDWYKQPARLCLHVAKLARQGQKPEVIFVRAKSADFALASRMKDEAPEQNLTPIIKKYLTLESGRTIELYEQWETERWNYINCREDFKAMFLWCERARHKLYIKSHGLEIPDEIYRALVEKRFCRRKRSAAAEGRSGSRKTTWTNDLQVRSAASCLAYWRTTRERLRRISTIRIGSGRKKNKATACKGPTGPH